MSVIGGQLVISVWQINNNNSYLPTTQSHYRVGSQILWGIIFHLVSAKRYHLWSDTGLQPPMDLLHIQIQNQSAHAVVINTNNGFSI